MLVYNPEEAKRDKANREQALSRIREELAKLRLKPTRAAVGELR